MESENKSRFRNGMGLKVIRTHSDTDDGDDHQHIFSMFSFFIRLLLCLITYYSCVTYKYTIGHAGHNSPLLLPYSECATMARMGTGISDVEADTRIHAYIWNLNEKGNRTGITAMHIM